MRAAIDLSGIQWMYISEEGRAWISDQGSSPLPGDVVKATDKRRVVRLPGIYVKEVHYQGMRRILKILPGGTACKEGRKSLALVQKGISTPHILAFGRENRWGLIHRDILITREVEDSKRLYDLMFEDYQGYSPREKRDLIRSFAEFIHRLHLEGAFHCDLHIGNILISRKGEENRFFLLDTDRIHFFHGGLSQGKKVENLSLLLVNFQKLTKRTEKFRFLKYYNKLEGRDRLDRRFVTDVGRKALIKSIKSWRKRALRAVGNNPHFVSGGKNTFRFFSQRSALARNALDVLLPDPDDLIVRGDVLKSGRTVKASTISIDGHKYFLKRYNDKGFIYRARNALRKSRAVNTWLVSWEFFFRGLPVPEPILCIEERRFRLLKRSYILYEYVDNALRLPQKWPSLDFEERKTLLIRLAMKLGWMHRTGGIHGDLKWNNILADENNNICFIDFDGSRVTFLCKAYKTAKDLERFLKDLSKFEKDEDLKHVFMNTWEKWH